MSNREKHKFGICYCEDCEMRRHALRVQNDVIIGQLAGPFGKAETAPQDRIGTAAERKAHPLMTGCLDYFPDALLAVAELSKIGNDQHNPGEPLHWARDKSKDHADCAGRHLIDRGKIDTDGVRHTTKAAWRILAELQLELEEANPGLGISRGSRTT